LSSFLFLYFRLSATAGVDFQALREKYKNPINQSVGLANKTESIVENEEKRKKDLELLAAMDVMRTCHICHGTGIERYTYNFQVREMNCSGCEGDGLVRKRPEVSKDNVIAPSNDIEDEDNPPPPF